MKPSCSTSTDAQRPNGSWPISSGFWPMLLLGFITGCLIAFTLTGCIGGGGSPAVPTDAGSLAGLEVLDGTQVVALSPAFDPTITSYAVSVGGSTASINVKATVADPKATIRINNTAAVSGVVFGPIPLNPGTNTVNIVVDVPGTVKAYILTVFRGTNANLAGLTVSPGSLAETFDPNVLAYSATVGTATTQVTVTATLADTGSNLKIKGQTVLSGQPSAPISLVVGLNTIDAVVTPLSGPTKTYIITVTRSSSPIADLSSIVVVNAANSQNITFSPPFSAGALNYTTQTVAFLVSAVRVTATVADPTSTLAIQPGAGQAFQSANPGVPFGPINLPNVTPVTNTIAIRVTAQNGSVKTYSLSVPRSPASTNTNLQALTLSSGVLFPVFSAGTLNYHASVTSTTPSVTITGTAQDATARVQINNQTPGQGSSAVSVPISPGVPVPVVVIAEDNSTKTYTVTFNRSANLLGLSLSAGAIQPAFSVSTLAYTLSVPNTTSTTTVTANQETVGSTMAVSVNGGAFTPLLSLIPSGPLGLNVGSNTVTIRVTAAVGSYQDYMVTVTKAAPGNVNLASLTVSAGTLTPAFSPSTMSYAVNVANSVANLTVTAAAQDVASATVSLTATPPGGVGQPSPLIISPLGVGTTTVTIVVTHTAGNSQVYTLTIVRNSADLTGLVITNGATNVPISPTFSSGALAYTITSVPPLATLVIAATPVAGASVSVTGGIPSGVNQFTVSLPPAQNPIPIIVTPATGPPATTYTVEIR